MVAFERKRVKKIRGRGGVRSIGEDRGIDELSVDPDSVNILR